ncbi:hypothetical protein AB6A40_007744 [Gnathostoma spinigerum]|uniref:Uncharacterized protein n=1 Tax=Gnathostoma spinigerum TaxID=75299 RepID=A0ABD6EM43_9BILA
MCDLYWSTRNDVERLLDSMQPHQRSDVLPLPPPLQMSQLKSFGTEGGQLQAAFTTVRPLLNVSNGHDNSINSSMSQLSSEFGRSTRNVSSQIRSNSPVRPSFPAAPSMLSGPPPFVVNGTSAHSQPVSAAIPPNMNIPPPSTARMSSSSTTYGAPVVGSVQPPPFSRPPPLENLASTSVVPPNLSQPPPIVTRTSSGTLPPPDFSIPPPSTSAMSIPPPTSLISSTSGTASDALTVSMSTTVSVVSSKPLVSNSTLPTTSTSTLPSIEPATSSANPSAKNLPPTINLSVPPPSFNIPPPRVTVSTFSTPPPTVDTHTSLAPHTSRPPPGPPPSLLMRPPPNLSVGAPPPLNLSIPPPPLSHNLSGPPPPLNLSCPPPAIRPTVLNSTSVSNAPPNVQQVLSAIVNQSAQSGQTPAEVVNEIIAATSYAPQQPRSSLNVSSSRSPVPASASIRSSPNSAAMQQTATTRIRIGPGGSTTLTSSLVGGPPSHITTPPTLPSSVANKVHTVSLSSTATSSSPVIPGSNSFRFMGCTSSQSGRYPFHLSPTCQPQQQQQTSSHRQLDTVPLVRDDSEGNQEESAGRPLNSDFIGMVARGPQRM